MYFVFNDLLLPKLFPPCNVLTITAGRVLDISAPTVVSKFIIQISPCFIKVLTIKLGKRS